MIVRIFKGVWFLSLLATGAVLLYIYASLPEDIQIREGDMFQFVSRSGLFYSALALLVAFNAAAFAFSKLLFGKNEIFMVWLYGLVMFLHFFVIVALQYLNLYNSQEKFNFQSIGFIIYGSIAMVVLWSSLWPAYFLFQRFIGKGAATNGTPS